MAAVVSILPGGATASVISPHSAPNPTRTQNKGWTKGASLRCAAFLRSIDFEALTGFGAAYTLTIPAAPKGASAFVSPVEFHTLLDSWLKRQARRGMIRYVWVIEWTRRGTPHLHISAWYSEEVSPLLTGVSDWLALTKNVGPSGTSAGAQTGEELTSAGWLQYSAKHGARGVKQYQRQSDNLTTEWRENPGRVWGKSSKASWEGVAVDPLRLTFETTKSFYRFRRLVKSWCRSNASKTKNPRLKRRYIVQARGMAKTRLGDAQKNRSLSSIKPVSVWIPAEITTSLYIAAGGSGEVYSPDLKRPLTPLEAVFVPTF